MTKYDPAFWEIPVDPAILEATLAAPDAFEQLFVTPEDERASADRARLKQEAIAQIRTLITSRLTPRQQRIVQLYFLEGMTQQEIARELGVSQQVVCRHLYGVIRSGRRVGGAMARLRKLADELGIDPKQWV